MYLYSTVNKKAWMKVVKGNYVSHNWINAAQEMKIKKEM